MASRALVAVLIAAFVVPSLAVALDLPGVDPVPAGQVTIVRDGYGVPHVYADDAYSLFWGNGYVQAQDRLFQMDVLRHVGKGDSARFLGPAQLEMDLATRRELYTDAERTERWNALPEDQRNMFQGFADGINAWIAQTRQNPTLLSAEFYAIGHAPEDWVAEDTIAIAEFLLDIFGAGSGGNEADNAAVLIRLVDELGEEEAEKAFNDLYPMHDPSTYTTIDPAEYTYAPTEGPLDLDDIPALQWEVIRAAANATPFAGGKSLVEAAQSVGLPTKFGSNAIVVGPELSENGAALLLGGPQMAYHNPMIPYEVALHGAGFDALGMGVGGAPGVIIGRTQDMAWTVTSGSSDQVDVVAERLNPENARQYWDPATSSWADMDCRIEVHVGPPTAIDQNPPVLAVQEVCRTARGPVFAMNEAEGWAFVRERTHRGDELRSGILWLTLAQNQDLESFREHMQTFRFEFNFHVATDDGDIAYYHWGAQPVRASGYDPRLPRVAGAWDWTGVRMGDELPHIVNPEKGYIVNWNNKPAQGWSGGDAAEKWGPVHRAELIERALATRLEGDGLLSMEELQSVNVEISTNSPFPDYFAPLLLDATAGVTSDRDVAARAALAAWAGSTTQWIAPDATCEYAREANGCFGTYEPGFIIYEEWRKAAQEAAYRDTLGRHVRELGFIPESSSDPHAADHGREDNKDNTLYHALLGETQHAWIDDADAFLQATFETALDTLEARFGSADPADWREPARTIKMVGLSGGPSWRFAMVNRPSFNHWYDFGADTAGSAIPPGTNQYWMPAAFLRFRIDGTLSDVHKDDQLKLYVAFGWKPADMVPAAVTTQTIVIP